VLIKAYTLIQEGTRQQRGRERERERDVRDSDRGREVEKGKDREGQVRYTEKKGELNTWGTNQRNCTYMQFVTEFKSNYLACIPQLHVSYGA
jgi:hypothetical protein